MKSWQMAQRTNSRNQFARNRLQRFRHVAIARLRNVVGGPECKSFQRGGGPVLGERAEHDDGNASVDLAQLAHRFQPIHLGHFDVEKDDVGLQSWKFR